MTDKDSFAFSKDDQDNKDDKSQWGDHDRDPAGDHPGPAHHTQPAQCGLWGSGWSPLCPPRVQSLSSG